MTQLRDGWLVQFNLDSARKFAVVVQAGTAIDAIAKACAQLDNLQQSAQRYPGRSVTVEQVVTIHEVPDPK